MRHIYTPFLALLLLSSCQPTLTAEFIDSPVVESYIYANRTPLVQIRRLIPLRSDISYSRDNLDSLNITLEDETDNSSVMMQNIGNGYYTHAQTIKSEHQYRLSFTYNQMSVTAETTVPAAPVDMKLSSRTLEVPVFGQRPASLTKISELMNSVEVYWKNPNKDYYLVVTECIEANPAYIRDTTYNSSPSTSFRMDPTQDTICRLTDRSFTYLGRHRVILFRLRPEYLLLLKTVSSNSQSLQEIRANINNGFGIFFGMDSDTIQLNVVKYLF
jgi:hypothetical protein